MHTLAENKQALSLLKSRLHDATRLNKNKIITTIELSYDNYDSIVDYIVDYFNNSIDGNLCDVFTVELSYERYETDDEYAERCKNITDDLNTEINNLESVINRQEADLLHNSEDYKLYMTLKQKYEGK